MVVCSSLKRAVTSAFIWRCRDGSSGKGYLLALNASQICTCKSHVRPHLNMLEVVIPNNIDARASERAPCTHGRHPVQCFARDIVSGNSRPVDTGCLVQTILSEGSSRLSTGSGASSHGP